MRSIVNRLKSFGKNQDGSSTIEFVLLFPTFVFVFLLGFESGYYMLRGVMLERGVDVAVRDVRIANGNVPDLVQMKTNICNTALMLPDCENSLQIEIRPISPVPGGVADAGTEIGCIDKTVDANDVANATIYNTGSGNQLMMVRVCALSEPLFPTTGIGAGLQVDSLGNYALVATSVFVNEPGDTTDRADVVASDLIPVGGDDGSDSAGDNP